MSEIDSIRDTLEETADDMEIEIKDVDLINPSSEPVEVEEVAEATAEPTLQVSDNESTDQVEEEGTPEQEKPTPIVPPPASWKAEEKEMFASLPPQAQEVIARRERERDTYLHQSRQKYAEVDKAVEPFAEELKRNGVSVGKMVSQALEWDKRLKDDPYGGIAVLARACGVDLKQFAKLAESAEPQDPYVRQLLQETNEVKSKLAEIEAEKERLKQNQERAVYSTYAQEVEAFYNARDNAGNALFPYAQTLEEDMVLLSPRVLQEMPNASTREVLEETYRRAMRANPYTYRELEKQQIQQQAQANQARVQKAKRAGSSIAGSPNGTKVHEATDLRSLLAGSAAELGIF